MPRFPLMALGVTAALLSGCGGSHRPSGSPGPGPLQGSWEVTSVLRDGEPDPLQVGAIVQFADNKVRNEVRFHPKVEQVVSKFS